MGKETNKDLKDVLNEAENTKVEPKKEEPKKVNVNKAVEDENKALKRELAMLKKKPKVDETAKLIEMNKRAQDAALLATIGVSSADVNVKVKTKEAEKKYSRSRLRYMKDKLKNDNKVRFHCSETYKTILGSPYTFLLNEQLVCVKFDGETRMLPEFIVDHLYKKLSKVDKANSYRPQTFKLNR